MSNWIDWVTEPEAWIALLSLTALEIVLGVDNIIFISILVARLPAQMRQRARTVGLGLAMGMRIGLLLSLAWIMHQQRRRFWLQSQQRWRDLTPPDDPVFFLFQRRARRRGIRALTPVE